MNHNDKDRFVDELLDASLRRYQSEEPPAGLEDRILANVRARDRAAPRRRWVWAWAFAASAAVLIVAVVVLRFTSRPAPRTATVSLAPQTVAPKAETPKMVAVAPPMSRIPGSPPRAPRIPAPVFRRPEQFPTPSPLSEQEQLLLAFVSQGPRSELSALAIRDVKIDPLEIPELKVAMIEIEKLSKSEESTKEGP
jgi:hypothetical protein